MPEAENVVFEVFELVPQRSAAELQPVNALDGLEGHEPCDGGVLLVIGHVAVFLDILFYGLVL